MRSNESLSACGPDDEYAKAKRKNEKKKTVRKRLSKQ